MVTLEGYAKINLCLAVVGRKGEKHLIDSVFCPVPIKDVVTVERADTVSVTYTDGRTYKNDTAFIAARRMSEKYGVGAKITIGKGIPEGAGLGGSSVDAGTVIRGIVQLYGLAEPDSDFLVGIGGDVPYFYRGGYARIRGVGGCVEEIDLPRLYTVVLVPKTGVNTGECYRLYDEIGGDGGDVDAFLKEVKEGKIQPFNALQKAGETLCPDVAEGVRILREAGFACGMTGSGSATFGVETNERAFKEKLRKVKQSANHFALYVEEE